MADETQAASDDTGTEPEVAPQSLEDMSEEELAAAIDGRGVEQAPIEAEPAQEPEPEPEPETPQEAADPVMERLSQMEQAMEAERLLREKAEARSQHLQHMFDSRAGEIGHLTKMLRDRESQPEQDDVEAAPSRESVPSEFQEALADWRSERIKQVVLEEVNTIRSRESAFFEALDKLPENDRKEFEQEFNARLSSEVEALGAKDAAASGNVKRVASVTRAAYLSALADTRVKFLPKFRASKQTAQTATIREKKLAATAGSAGARPTPRSRTIRSLDDLSADEIAKEITRRERHGIVI
jgi:hypothetical protein